MSEPVTPERAKTAVIYLRVSTPGQAHRGGEAEGYSIPAQREQCRRKAASLHAEVVQEFVDPGVSAKTADRPELQRMIEYARAAAVDFVIFRKSNRLARHTLDAATIWDVLVDQAGIELISCCEETRNTAAGRLNFIIFSGLGEYENRNLKTEVIKGMTQKAKIGGTPGKPPVGYLNISKIVNGQIVVRTIEIDPERAPLIIWAFEVYATGVWSLNRLTAEPRTARPPNPIDTQTAR